MGLIVRPSEGTTDKVLWLGIVRLQMSFQGSFRDRRSTGGDRGHWSGGGGRRQPPPYRSQQQQGSWNGNQARFDRNYGDHGRSHNNNGQRASYEGRDSWDRRSFHNDQGYQKKKPRHDFEQGGRRQQDQPFHARNEGRARTQEQQQQQQSNHCQEDAAPDRSNVTTPPWPNRECDRNKFPLPDQVWQALDRKGKMLAKLPNESTLIDSLVLHQFPEDFSDRCTRAVQETVRRLSELCPEENQHSSKSHHYDSDGDDSDDSSCDIDGMRRPNMDPGRNRTNPSASQDPHQKYRKFVEALPECVALDYGFHVFSMGYNHSATCYCPCRKKMKNSWQKQFGLDAFVPLCTTAKETDKGFTDHALIQHCAQKAESCVFHKLTLEYLKTLFHHYHTSSLNHKALYKPSDRDYRRAEDRQNRAYWEKLRETQRELEEARREKDAMKKHLEELQKVREERGGVGLLFVDA